jgi:hypothetical protein
MRKSLILLSLFVAAPASAQTLWQDVQYGMTSSQLRAAYPEGKGVSYAAQEVVIRGYAVTGKCLGDVHIRLSGGRVDQVEIRGHGAMNERCSDAVLDGLSAHYGPPLTVAPDDRAPIFQAGSIAYSWHRDGLRLRFFRFPNNNLFSLASPSWVVDYALEDEAKL